MAKSLLLDLVISHFLPNNLVALPMTSLLPGFPLSHLRGGTQRPCRACASQNQSFLVRVFRLERPLAASVSSLSLRPVWPRAGARPASYYALCEHGCGLSPSAVGHGVTSFPWFCRTEVGSTQRSFLREAHLALRVRYIYSMAVCEYRQQI